MSKCQTGTTSVIIPVYNGAKTITRAIESAINQECVELVVVDDKSTDDTLAILRKYEARGVVVV